MTVVNLRWFSICLLPLGLIAMSGCSPPKAASVSQASNTPSVVPAVTPETAPAETATAPAAAAPVASAPDESNAPGGNAERMPEYDPEAEAARAAEYAASQPGNRNNANVPDMDDESDAENEPDSDESGADSEDAEIELPPFPGPTGKKGTEVGDLIPEIKGKDIDKKSFKLSDYSGRVVMIDFWGDW